MDGKVFKIIRCAIIIAFALLSINSAKAQRISLKSNALYWAAMSPNLGVELRVNRHVTFNFEGTCSFLNYGKYDTKALMFTPEMRYWFSARPQAGHFIGLAGIGIDYNFTKDKSRHKGDIFGAGLTYGYSFVLSRHWSLETTVGAGEVYRHEKSFAKESDEPKEVNVRKWQLAPIKIGATFVYIIK